MPYLSYVLFEPPCYIGARWTRIRQQESRGQESFNNGYTMGSVNVKCTIFDKEDTKMVEIGLVILDFVVDFYEVCAASWMVCCDLIIA